METAKSVKDWNSLQNQVVLNSAKNKLILQN